MRERDHFRWVEVRLHYWGEWQAKRVDGLGFPGRTQEGRLMDEGPVGSTTNYRDHSPDVEFAHKEHETDRAVQRLPPEWRLVVWRIHVDGKTHAQVGNDRGRSPAWVKQIYSQAIAFLAAAIPGEAHSVKEVA